jgi:precorrin-6B methylase 2
MKKTEVILGFTAFVASSFIFWRAFAYWDYFSRGIIPPIYLEDYDSHWGFTDFKNKVILDLGADYGSTAYYFLQKGAGMVIAVEGNDELFEKLKRNFKDNPKVIPIHMKISRGQQVEELIDKYRPDLVKVDIEGAEIYILNADVKKVKEWLIETHTDDVYDALHEFFLKNGFTVKTFYYGINYRRFFGKLKIIYAYYNCYTHLFI